MVKYLLVCIDGCSPDYLRHAVDLGKVLTGADISAEVIPIIKDRYVEHHQNMGGAAFAWLPS